MANHTGGVVGGVDAHTDEHHVAVVDLQGRLLGATAFPTTAAGYARMISWLRSHGEVERAGLESTGAYAAGLVRALRAGGISVGEVNQPQRHARQRLGKSDPIDAELAARAALSRTATAVPNQTRGIVEAIRQLQVVRTSALKARHAALQQLNDLIVTAPEQLRSELRHGRTMKAKAALCQKLRPDTQRIHEPAQAAKLALSSLARRIHELDREILELDRQLEQLVRAAAPRTTQLFGVGTQGASQLLIDPGGDRQANRALHMIAVCRLRYCQRTQAYATKRTADGLNKRDILRCLKRYIARETFHTLRADLKALDST